MKVIFLDLRICYTYLCVLKIFFEVFKVFLPDSQIINHFSNFGFDAFSIFD